MIEGVACGCKAEVLGGVTMWIDPETSGMSNTLIPPEEDEAHVDFRAEIDCLVTLRACPEWGRGGPVRVEIFEE